MDNDTHKHMALEDQLRLLGELEHGRAHALRSAHAVKGQEDKFFWLVTAARYQRLRRQVQGKIGEIATEDWCALKVAQNVRQLNYELMSGDEELFNELEDLVDSVNSHVLKRDMTGCGACTNDMQIENRDE